MDNAKDSIFLEEIKILYKFEFHNIKNGEYKVTYNFSNALKNKKEVDGVFSSNPLLKKTTSIKGIRNIKSLEKKLSKEIENIKTEKLKQFKIIE